MPQHPATSNESRIRLTAFFVLILTILYIVTGQGWIAVFLLGDFALRAFSLPAYSPLSWTAGRLTEALHLPQKPVYMPPKRFAARIGFAFFLAIVILHYAGITTTILAGIIVLFAALESLANFCAGCYVYTLLVRLKKQ
jgi:hypothetical protein